MQATPLPPMLSPNGKTVGHTRGAEHIPVLVAQAEDCARRRCETKRDAFAPATAGVMPERNRERMSIEAFALRDGSRRYPQTSSPTTGDE